MNSSGFAFGNDAHYVCCTVHNFHPLGWVPSTSTTSSTTTTTTTTIAPHITLTVEDISVFQTQTGIIDLTSTTEWNDYFDSSWGDPTGAAFTSVNITGNTIKLYGGLDGLLYIPFYNLNITGFDTTSHLPSIIEIDIAYCKLTEFNPSVQITSTSMIGDLYLPYNNITEFNPTFSLPNSIEGIILESNLLTSFNPVLPLPSNLNTLNLSRNLITDFNPTLPLPDSLQIISLLANQITTFNPTLPLPTSLIAIVLSGNLITNFNPTLPLPTGFRKLYVDLNHLTNFNPTLGLPNLDQLVLDNNTSLTNFNINLLQSNIKQLTLSNCALNTTIINSILAKCVALNVHNDNPALTPYISLQNGTNGPPTGQGITDKNTLISRGCTVQTN